MTSDVIDVIVTIICTLLGQISHDNATEQYIGLNFLVTLFQS